MESEIRMLSEHEMTPELHSQVTDLRNTSFPSHQKPRSYGKQYPHFRLLLHSGDRLVGHLGVDHRAIRFGESVYSVFGLIALCVAPDQRQQGIGGQLVSKLEKLARSSDIDLLLLLAQDPRLYDRQGFKPINATCQWLRIDEHRNWGVATEEITNELMIMPLKPGLRIRGMIDFLGHIF